MGRRETSPVRGTAGAPPDVSGSVVRIDARGLDAPELRAAAAALLIAAAGSLALIMPLRRGLPR